MSSSSTNRLSACRTVAARILRAFVGRGLPEKADANDRLAYQHSGFSVDEGVCIGLHDLWALLLARIYEVFPLLCQECGGQMHLIAFITAGTQTGKILDHIGEDCAPPHIAPARGPPLWDGSVSCTRRAPQITLLNTKPWW